MFPPLEKVNEFYELLLFLKPATHALFESFPTFCRDEKDSK